MIKKIKIHKHADRIFNLFPDYKVWPNYNDEMDEHLGKVYTVWGIKSDPRCICYKLGGWLWPIECLTITEETTNENQ